MFSSTKATVRQVIRSVMRDCAVWMIGALWPSSRPATTTEMTPEAWISSAATNAANGVRNEIAVSISGSRDPLAQPGDEEEEADADQDAAAGSDDEVARHRGDGHAAGQRGDRGAEGDEGGCVVEQRLTLEDRHDAPRQPDAPGHRRRGDGVRGCDDGSDGDRGRPAQARHQPVDDRGHRERRDEDEQDREPQDRAAVGVEVDQRGLDRRRVEQRRQQPQQHDLRLEVDRRDAGDVRRRGADDDQQERRRDAQPLADGGGGEHDGCHGDEQQGEFHRVILAPRAPLVEEVASHDQRADGQRTTS